MRGATAALPVLAAAVAAAALMALEPAAAAPHLAASVTGAAAASVALEPWARSPHAALVHVAPDGGIRLGGDLGLNPGGTFEFDDLLLARAEAPVRVRVESESFEGRVEACLAPLDAPERADCYATVTRAHALEPDAPLLVGLRFTASDAAVSGRVLLVAEPAP